MIIQYSSGELRCAATGRTWLQRKGNVVLDAPPLDDFTLHESKDGADCRAFLESLALRLDAVRWNPDKRRFVPVSGGSDG